MKSEPESFSWADLLAAPRRTTHWDGVRNHQAKLHLRDGMRLGDAVLFYHSGAEPPAVVGIAEVVREAYPDSTAFNRHDPHYDPKSDPSAPTWVMVDLKARTSFVRPVTLPELRTIQTLEGMELLRKGSRLSVQPVRPHEFDLIAKLGSGAGA